MQSVGGFTKQTSHPDAQMGPQRRHLPPAFQPVGKATHQHFCHSSKHEVFSLFFPQRHTHDSVDTTPSLPFSSYSSLPLEHCQTLSGALQCDSYNPMVAQTTLVHHAPLNLQGLHHLFPIPHLLTQHQGQTFHPNLPTLHFTAWRIQHL